MKSEIICKRSRPEPKKSASATQSNSPPGHSPGASQRASSRRQQRCATSDEADDYEDEDLFIDDPTRMQLPAVPSPITLVEDGDRYNSVLDAHGRLREPVVSTPL